jgi:transcriptional antiterminator RfaH
MLKMTNIPPDYHADREGAAWYCLRAQPKHERIATRHLRMLEGVIVFLPRIRFKKRTLRGLVWVTEAMFPSYLFAHFELAMMHRQVRFAHGVSDIVRFGERYPIIEDCTLARLRDRTDVADVRELSNELSPGEQVKIADGGFVGLEAVIKRVLPAKQRISVLMDLLGRKVEVDIEHSSIRAQVVYPLVA